MFGSWILFVCPLVGKFQNQQAVLCAGRAKSGSGRKDFGNDSPDLIKLKDIDYELDIILIN